MSEELKLYPRLFPIRYILGFVGAMLLVVTIKYWNELPFKTAVLALVAGVVLIITTFALKHEHLRRMKLLGNL